MSDPIPVSDLPSYQDATGGQSRTPRRPPSPSPSYHTIAADDHFELPFASSPSRAANSEHDILRNAALRTPGAVLSHLDIANVHGNPASSHARFLSVRTDPDGLERYHTTFPSSSSSNDNLDHDITSIQQAIAYANVLTTTSILPDMLVYRGPRTLHLHQQPIASVKFNVADGHNRSGVQIVFDDGEDWHLRYEDLRARSLPIELVVDGERRQFFWQVKTKDSSNDEHLKLATMKLVDAQHFYQWAVYRHEYSKVRDGLKSASWHSASTKTAAGSRWGRIEVMCRAALLDEGVDRALVSMVALLEGYMRMYGSGQPLVDSQALVSAGALCSVM